MCITIYIGIFIVLYFIISNDLIAVVQLLLYQKNIDESVFICRYKCGVCVNVGTHVLSIRYVGIHKTINILYLCLYMRTEIEVMKNMMTERY